MSETNGMNGDKSHSLENHWKFGLVNTYNKYLTAEKFGFEVNVTGTSMKNKQIWTLEQDQEFVCIRSHLGRYLTVDKYGNVKCESEERGSDAKFIMEYNAAGKWMFKENSKEGRYLGLEKQNTLKFVKNISDETSWTVQLCIHPQVHLRNVNRKRYAQLKDDEIQCMEANPWGEDSLIILEFIDGKYALKSFDNRYLNKDGSLTAELSDDCKYSLEIKAVKAKTEKNYSSGLAFKSSDGMYLTPVGSTATMKSKNAPTVNDYLFTIEESHPQVAIFDCSGKIVSIKGQDVHAKHAEMTDTETFQMEYDKSTNTWSFRTKENKFWNLQESSMGIEANCTSLKDTCRFSLEWQGDGTVAMKSSNSNYLFSKPNGSLTATSSSLNQNEYFKVRIINRPLLVLRSEFGFVGRKPKSEEVCCNRVSYDLIHLSSMDNGKYSMKDSEGKYWSVGDNNMIMADNDSPTEFIIEFHGLSMLSIIAPNGKYLQGEQNGLLKAVGETIANNTKWEF